MKGLIDSTLREGEQTVGVRFRLEQKLEIVKLLCRIGVEEIELGVANRYDNDLADLVKYCRQLKAPGNLAIWCRCNLHDIIYAISAAPDVLSLSIPVSDFHIEKKLGKSRPWVLKTVQQAINKAGKCGIPKISLGLEDATRAELDFIQSVVKVAEQAGAARVRLADTVGVASPSSIAELIKQLKKHTCLEIGVHMHNDFGMATANSVAALEAGADYADVTSLGIGERAGNAKLEEVAGFLALAKGHPYDPMIFKPLAEYLAGITDRMIDTFQPVIGDNIFHCESGLHLQGLKKDASTYEPYVPERVGLKRKFFYGAKIGKKEIEEVLESRGVRPHLKQLEKLVGDFRTFSKQQNRPLLQNDFNSLLMRMQIKQ